MPRHRIRIERSWLDLLPLASQAQKFSLLCGNDHPDPYGKYDWLLAWDADSGSGISTLNGLKSSLSTTDWLFGHLSFDLKNQLEKLSSRHEDPLQWEDLSFYSPVNVAYQKGGEIWLESLKYQKAIDLYQDLSDLAPSLPQEAALNFTAQTNKAEYLGQISRLKEELNFGNIYEINFCMHWDAEGSFDPLAHFLHLNQKHRAPFSALHRNGNHYLLSFSPERYFCKRGSQIYSQPIKGTAKRGATPEEDKNLKDALLASEKERAENVMIVDLVRNDLSRTAAKNSVQVEELYGIYSFNAVHQMISTVTSTLAADKDLVDVITTTFPMGSMTGAPKISALKIIDRLEKFKRGIYSGSVGYIDPSGDADFNVVIRSIAYQAEKKIARIGVGSAITVHCDAELEYQECLLKAEKLIS